VYKPTPTQVFSSASYIANASVLNSIQWLPLSKPKIVQIQPDRTGSLSTVPQLSQTNKSPVPSIPRNVGHGRGKSVDYASQVTKHVSGLYHQQERDTKREHEERLRNLKEYLRNHLFPKWKLFTRKKQMASTDREGGIILKICNDLHVREESRIYWWDMNKKAILAALNRKRNDVTTYLKKHFCCKFYIIRKPQTAQIFSNKQCIYSVQ
jgi:1,2-phenylacetyl-CoA epoxidase PaaB subunit